MSTIKIIKVNATKSTNDKVKMLIKSKKINTGQIICAKYQYKGKGQSSKRWYSSYDKNLLCSLYYEFHDLDPRSSYLVNYAVSLAVLKTVKKFITNKTYIKWPNDILSENKKISGILIENTITLKKINNCVIGVGLNVNQTVFNKLPFGVDILMFLSRKKYLLSSLIIFIIIKKSVYNFQDHQILNQIFYMNSLDQNYLKHI